MAVNVLIQMTVSNHFHAKYFHYKSCFLNLHTLIYIQQNLLRLTATPGGSNWPKQSECDLVSIIMVLIRLGIYPTQITYHTDYGSW